MPAENPPRIAEALETGGLMDSHVSSRLAFLARPGNGTLEMLRANRTRLDNTT